MRTLRRFRGALLGAALLASPIGASNAQTLTVPRAMRQAVANGTRTATGQPGARYWQNHARYAIDLSVTPATRSVSGSEQIVYHNDSPDALRELVVKLFMNIHKPGAPRAVAFTEDYLTEGITVESVAINGAAVALEPASPYTIASVKLAKPLASHDSVRLDVRWHYHLSRQPGREGMIDSTTAYLAYFYPRVAVYDDVDGWDRMEFADLQEFYNDFNDYDVTVRVPANYVVWGTGTLANAERVLTPETLGRFQKSMTSDSTIHIATRREMIEHRVTAPASESVWRFTSRGVPDVAFGVSDHYAWDAASVIVDSAAKRRTSVQAAFNDSAADFHSMVQMARHSLAFMSHAWPGVPYPYEKSTVFQGGAGMEYPMMVNDESYPDTSFADLVAAHEIAHTWFPFYMGINETRYPFMDEGWATTFEFLIGTVNMGAADERKVYHDFRVSPWADDRSVLVQLPIVTPADIVKNPTYRANAYGKPSLGYLAVKDLLGDSLFRRALHGYMSAWHGKHPTPWDFFAAFNQAAGTNLDWFWSNWFFGSGYIDLGIAGVHREKSGYAITIDNVGGLAAPADLALTFADGSTQVVHESIAMWKHDRTRAMVSVPSTKTLRSVELRGDLWTDVNAANDRWSAPDSRSR